MPPGVLRRAPKLAFLLTTATLSGLVPACDAHSRSGGVARTVTCQETRYLLHVNPRTIVSNERDHLHIRANRDVCGRRAPVRGASVRLGSQQATTDVRGRATLMVRLQTGRYLVRLYVRGRVAARAPVKAIPNVAG